jgi:enamine deaminase RidA (YjgF/YER057c/UK114 family)
MVHQGLVYVAGQLPIDPRTGEKKLGSIAPLPESLPCRP